MIDLQQSRDEIDKVDKQIVELFEHRMQLAKDVAEYKVKTGKKILDKQREQEKLEKLMNLASNDFNKTGIQELFIQIMSMSRKFQYSLIGATEYKIPFQQIDKLDLHEGTKVACFGVKGSYTEQAMEEYFGTEITGFNVATFRGIMEAIKNGSADYGVLPIENTSTGGITDIYDLLVEYDNYIIGEHVVKIEHALLGLHDSKLENIQKVFSHPQALMQSSKFISQHKNMVGIECTSTSDSAKKVLEEKEITQAAIASKRAGELYGLKILAEGINHENLNSTRFIIISRKKEYIKHANKISICFELPHESGSLYNMLSHFIYNNLNMTKIESRPLEGRRFEYRFFIDFEGNLNDPGVKNALTGIGEEAIALKVLGNYKTI